jgi:hypothetical protein
VKSTIYFTQQELTTLLALSQKFDADHVAVEFDNDSGIGAVIHAVFDVVHQGTEGQLRVNITDESNW